MYKDETFRRYISSARQGSTLDLVDDIVDIAAPSVDEQDLARKEAVVELIGISGVQKYHGCSKCKKKIENVDESSYMLSM